MSIDESINKLGIQSLNAMQSEAIEAVLRTANDVVIISPTGTGKTLAYLLPLVEKLKRRGDDNRSAGEAEPNSGQPSPSAVVIVPGRELALQSNEVMKSMGSGLRSMALYGGRPTMDEHRELRKIMPDIVFGTPGRLNDHVEKGNFSVESVRWLVIDEFDKCLEMGFLDEMKRLVGSLPNVERRILLSATEAEDIPAFVRMNRISRIDYGVNGTEEDSDRVKLFMVESPERDKLATLAELLLDFGDESTVVFLNHRESVERTALYLKDKGFGVSLFHGGLEQREREAALYRFSNGSANVLVTTDLASRGLDVPDINNVVHYHLPETQENYVHRTGRTARWDRHGRAFFVLNGDEHVPEYIAEEVAPYVCTHANSVPAKPRMVTLYIGKGKKDKLSKGDIVGFLCKKGGLKAGEIGKISVTERYTYVAVDRRKAKEVLARVRGEKIKGLKTIVEMVK